MDAKYHDDIVNGRAYVRLIEATDVLLKSTLTAHDRHAMERAQKVAKTNLRELVANLPPELTAQILIASEAIVGPVGDALQN